MSMQEADLPKGTPIKFNFFRLNFTPYKESTEQTTGGILSAVITFLSQQQQEGKGILIDRHEGRKTDIPRPLFVTSVATSHKEKRIKISMALLRKGRMPMLKPAEKFILVPLDKGRGEIAEQTHIFIDFSTPSRIMCVEFNSNGPRISDIEYYFRVVAHDKLKMAKATDIEMFMDTSIDETLKDLKNVLNMEFKVQPQKLNQLDTALVGSYFTAVTNLGQHVKPNFVRLEMFFQTPGNKVVSSQINKEGLTMFKRLLEAFKAKKTNVDVFDSFVVKYQTENGKEEYFNLFKGKKELLKYVDESVTVTPRDWHDLISDDFDKFMETQR